MLGLRGRHEKRVALVMGNGAYQNAKEKLQNPVRDAAETSAALRRLKFEVRCECDLTHRQMVAVFDYFEADIHGADVALLDDSGHGLQVSGVNYLIPVDARIETEDDTAKLVSVKDLIERMSSHSKARLVLLDACRNNPFAKRFNDADPQ